MIKKIKNQIEEMNIIFEDLIHMRSKDGVHLYRVSNAQNSYVLKYFENKEFRREIENYKLLRKLDIFTVPLIAYTDEAILMEDLSYSIDMRLAVKEDMDKPDCCYSLGRWYRNLHKKGAEYVKFYGDSMYMESDCITIKNISRIMQKTKTASNPVWRLLEKSLDSLYSIIDKTEKTLTYNDYYYTNMAISKEHGAFMFDYNLLGKGYVASDIVNVTIQLSDDGKRAFLDGYGEYNEKEILLHDVVGTLVGLHFACDKKIFPDWGYEELDKVKNKILEKKLRELLN